MIQIAKSYKLVIFFALLFLITSHTQAQECDYILKGNIADKDSKKILEVSALDLPDGLRNKHHLNRKRNSFVFTGLCHQSYTITITHEGYDTLTTSFIINTDTTINFLLVKHSGDVPLNNKKASLSLSVANFMTVIYADYLNKLKYHIQSNIR